MQVKNKDGQYEFENEVCYIKLFHSYLSQTHKTKSYVHVFYNHLKLET